MSQSSRTTASPPPWHCLSAQDAVSRLQSDAETGLTAEQIAIRAAEAGPNIIAEKKHRSGIAMFLAQFRDFMILVLLAAAVVSGFIGDPQDTIAIIVIVLLNAIIGAVQEYRAERAVEALRELAAPAAQVLRDGVRSNIASAELVPGDLVFIEAGNVVPADLRLLEASDLQVDESAMTGEAHGARKNVEALIDPELPLGDRTNLAFKGSLVSTGRGRGIVIATGSSTEFGQIAELLSQEESVTTPLQQRLSRFGRYLAIAVLAICAVVFVSGLLQGQPVLLMLLTAVSLAVAAIPEALPAVVTVSLAFGARGLSHNNALVRRLPAVETLGSVTYICADKTGTLTENRMRAELFLVGDERNERLVPAAEASPPWLELGMALALNNDVTVSADRPSGDPTEVALYEAAREAGYLKDELERAQPRLAELAFDSERKLMTTLHAANGGVRALVKGAPEAVIPRCRNLLGKAGVATLEADAALQQAEILATQGYRVLALATRTLDVLPEPLDSETTEHDLSFLGLVALIDPPRQEAAQAVAECKSAGITPVMITGDHPGTAHAIAARLGIISEGDTVVTGADLARMTEDELIRVVKTARVYARVSPLQKTHIVKALQTSGEFVAMTGDGVNDAPALKRAGIGVAMGMRGTEVAREAADMVLLDDNFATIVAAVRSGRRIFDNIRKFIKDTMSSNSGEIWTLFLAPFLGLPVPLLPIHILWINLVTDGLPGLAFTAEPAEPRIMQRAPRPPQENIFAHGMWQHILWVGLLVGGLSIASQAWSLGRGDSHWQTVVFTVLTLSQLFHSLAVRSERASLFRIGLLSNLPMLGAVLLTVGLQLAVIYVPVFNDIFHTQPLPMNDLLVCFALSSLVLVAVELEKLLIRRGLIYQAS